ncbi:MAG: RluA family pseudouridine synthase [Kiritimatiellae bacterium]|nr:RluA family pseudouridine synthase [Kiritimatiellia bacterium]
MATHSAPKYASGILTLVTTRDDQQYLQDFLAQRLSLSRRSAKAVIDGRNVWVNRKCVWIARYKLKTGDKIEVPEFVVKSAAKQSSRSQVPAKAINEEAQKRRHIRVIWSDESYLVCDKPAGVLSCETEDSVERILRAQESLPHLVAVHRLDRDTTGCLLFAKNHAAFLAAVEVFKTRKVLKIYHAVAAGRFEFKHKIINAALDGKEAISNVALESVSDDASFLRVRIETGRTNQIRRHLAQVRHPIVGDRVFGLKSARDARLMQVPRQMLHASSLSLPHPLSPRLEINVHAPLPADFRATLKLFGMGKRK